MTDLERWKKFLTENGIPFHESTDDYYDCDENGDDVIIPMIYLGIGYKDDYKKEKDTKEYDKYFHQACSACYGYSNDTSLDILFKNDGSFFTFVPWCP